MLDWDNSIMPDEENHLSPWQVLAGTAGIEYPEADDVARHHTMSACVANLTVSRLMADRSERHARQDLQSGRAKNLDISLINMPCLCADAMSTL
ncbi:hypothetical protein [Duncaniella muris]|uniref:hypothetical protein n=1 Tax=Duncaniella muris TaxID=2094150 RepID=UPI003F676A1B